MIYFLKQVYLSEGEDSSRSSESIELNSSEDSAPHVEPPQEPLFTETDRPAAMEDTKPPSVTTPHPPVDAAVPPTVTFTIPALPDPDDPQTSADASHVTDDPSQTAPGIDTPAPDQGQVLIDAASRPVTQVVLLPRFTNTDVIAGADGMNQPQVPTHTTYQGFCQSVTPPPLGAIPLPTHALVPVCFSFQVRTPEPEPPRGDNM